MRFDDEPDWHGQFADDRPHPSDRREIRERLLTALGLAIVAAAIIWGLGGYKGLWSATERSFPAPEQQPVAP